VPANFDPPLTEDRNLFYFRVALEARNYPTKRSRTAWTSQSWHAEFIITT
jgi:hypothetical protein